MEFWSGASDFCPHHALLQFWLERFKLHDRLTFFPKLAAFNISWREKPERSIYSYAAPKGWLTKPGMENYEGSHADEYWDWLAGADLSR